MWTSIFYYKISASPIFEFFLHTYVCAWANVLKQFQIKSCALMVTRLAADVQTGCFLFQLLEAFLVHCCINKPCLHNQLLWIVSATEYKSTTVSSFKVPLCDDTCSTIACGLYAGSKPRKACVSYLTEICDSKNLTYIIVVMSELYPWLPLSNPRFWC